MNVQELIDQLMTIEDKSKVVFIGIESGYSCFSQSTNISFTYGSKAVQIYGKETGNDQEGNIVDIYNDEDYDDHE